MNSWSLRLLRAPSPISTADAAPPTSKSVTTTALLASLLLLSAAPEILQKNRRGFEPVVGFADAQDGSHRRRLSFPARDLLHRFERYANFGLEGVFDAEGQRGRQRDSRLGLFTKLVGTEPSPGLGAGPELALAVGGEDSVGR